VRLIAEFHGGVAEAANLPDNSGAIFTVRLRRFGHLQSPKIQSM